MRKLLETMEKAQVDMGKEGFGYSVDRYEFIAGLVKGSRSYKEDRVLSPDERVGVAVKLDEVADRVLGRLG